MLKRLLAGTVLLAVAVGLAASGNAAAREKPLQRPRLVVVISIDQCRADYLTRFADLYLAPGERGSVGGFRYLQERAAWYPDCRYEHHRTVTGVGHAILSTGAQPAVNGIVGNTWWDRAGNKRVYCTDDPKTEPVGPVSSSDKPMSPANLLTTTVGDELELATGGQSRTVSISLKDRASILLAGHRADQSVWFSDSSGKWISSRHYCPDGKLPAWTEKLNGDGLAERLRATPWTPSVDGAILRRAHNLKGEPAAPFSHNLSGSFGAMTVSPAGNEILFTAAREAVRAESLGRDDVPDLLTLNLASNDYVGHKYGPDSPEVLDISVRTDRQLSEFFTFLDRTVPGGLENVTIALSADHGVATVPELAGAQQAPGGRANVAKIREAADAALDSIIGPADWIASTSGAEDIYFSEAALKQYAKESRERIEAIACEAGGRVPGVHMILGRAQVLNGRVPLNALGRRVTNGVHPDRSGDLIVILKPGWLAGGGPGGTSHGQPFPYDSHVPLVVAGFGIRPGVYGVPVSPARLAPTLAHLLRVARPSGADEPLLPGIDGVVP